MLAILRFFARFFPIKRSPPMIGGARKPVVVRENHVTALAGRGTAFKGHLVGEALIRLDGDFIGIVYGLNQVYISKAARIKADIYAHHITINGLVQGNLYASGLVEFLPNSVFIGEIYTPSFKVKPGAKIHSTTRVAQEFAMHPSVEYYQKLKDTVLLEKKDAG